MSLSLRAALSYLFSIHTYLSLLIIHLLVVQNK